MASTRSSTNKHEPTSPDLDKNQKRKLRNRLSQRAFRRRQAEYLRDLKNRAEASQKPDNERVADLEEENGRLRAHITELQSRLEGVQVTLQMIASSSSKILGRSKSFLPPQPRNEERDSEHQENEPSRDDIITADKVQSDSDHWPPFSSTALEAIQVPDLSFPTDVDSTIEVPISDAAQTRSSLVRDIMDSVGPIDPNLSKSPLQLQRIPNIWNFSYQMGSHSYTDAIESCASSRPPSGVRWVDSNLPTSDHIRILRRLLLTKLKPTIRHNQSFQTLYESVSTVLATFNSVTRPDVVNWYAKTRFFHTIERKSRRVPPGIHLRSRTHRKHSSSTRRKHRQHGIPPSTRHQDILLIPHMRVPQEELRSLLLQDWSRFLQQTPRAVGSIRRNSSLGGTPEAGDTDDVDKPQLRRYHDS